MSRLLTIYILIAIQSSHCLANYTDEQLELYITEVRSLSELPLDRLIHIKSSFAKGAGKDLLQITQPKSLQEPKEKEKDKDMDKDIDNNNSKENKTTEASSRTAALPLTMKKAGVRGGPLRRHEEHGEQRGHDTKISKIFQLAVTTLSFLAFGGYLLTLIITSARRASMNNMTMTPANVIVFSVSIFANHLAKLFLLYKQHIPLRTIKDKITVSIVSHKLAKNQNLQKVGKYQRPKRSSPFYLDPSENDFDTDRLYNGMIMLSKGYVLYHNGKLGF